MKRTHFAVLIAYVVLMRVATSLALSPTPPTLADLWSMLHDFLLYSLYTVLTLCTFTSGISGWLHITSYGRRLAWQDRLTRHPDYLALLAVVKQPLPAKELQAQSPALYQQQLDHWRRRTNGAAVCIYLMNQLQAVDVDDLVLIDFYLSDYVYLRDKVLSNEGSALNENQDDMVRAYLDAEHRLGAYFL